MQSLYVVARSSAVSGVVRARASALLSAPVAGDPTAAYVPSGEQTSSGVLSAFPSVVVTSPALTAPIVIPDNTGQATLAQVQAAQQKALDAEKAQESGISTSLANLQSVITNLAAGLTQAQTDAATCAASSDPLAPILGRVVTDLATVAQSLGDVLVALRIVQASDVPGA